MPRIVMPIRRRVLLADDHPGRRIFSEDHPVVLKRAKPSCLISNSQSVFAGLLRVTPLERSYRFDGEQASGEFLAGAYEMASPMPASWNQIIPWLRQIDGLRQVA